MKNNSMENKILFINSCARQNSHTNELAQYLLSYLEGEKTHLNLYEANLHPIYSSDLDKRTENIKNKNFFGIKNIVFYSAEGLDIFEADVKGIMEETKKKITMEFKKINQ